ncbi:MAG: flagellar hook-associated protein FlgK, partial [Clostridia bacterium]|nr:flagellar hook-associated protein FlgK [Clostridia bacterium]
MRSTFYGFEIGKSGLYASQQNLNVTGHNIANADTKGFTRQELKVESIPAPFYMGLIAYNDKSDSGQGVRMMYVDQIR